MADETNLEQEFPWGLNEVDESLDFHTEGGSLEDVKSNQCRKLKRDKNYHKKFIYVNDFSEKHVDDWVLGLKSKGTAFYINSVVLLFFIISFYPFQ